LTLERNKEKGVLTFDKEDFSKKSAERFGSFKRLHYLCSIENPKTSINR
jgi:hypothetical protein